MIKKYRVQDFVKYGYSEIKQYAGEGYTDTPLRNDEIVDLLNKQEERIKELEKENKTLKEEIKTLKYKLSSYETE